MGRKKKELVWTRFIKRGKGAECTFCKKIYQVANVNKMETHLLQCAKCPDEVRSQLRRLENGADLHSNISIPSTETDTESDVNVSSFLSNSRSSTPIRSIVATPTPPPYAYAPQSQRSMTSFLDRTTDEENAELNIMLAKAVYISGSPLALVEHPLWKEFFHKLRPSYRLPSRKVLSTTMLDTEYSKIQTDVAEKLNESNNYNLQCDGWSNIRNEPIMNFIITQPEPLLVDILQTKDKKHDRKYLFEEIEKVLLKYGIAKFLVVIADNAANMQAALDLLVAKYPHLISLGCLCHTLNLLSRDIVTSPSAEKLFLDAKLIVNTIKRSQRLISSFSQRQKEKKIQCSLKLPGDTRWNSYLNCLISLHKNKGILQLMAVDAEASVPLPDSVKKLVLDDGFWIKGQSLIDILDPIVKGTLVFESNQPIIHKAFTTQKRLTQEVTNNLELSDVFDEEEKKRILEKLARRNKNILKPILQAAYILDPATMGSQLTSSEILDGLEFIYKVAVDMKLDGKQVMAEISHYRTREDIWSKAFVWASCSLTSPIVWWKTYFAHTVLATIAIKILSSPIATASTERSFSTASLIHTKKRNRLTTERASKLTYMTHNYKLLSTISPKKRPATSSLAESEPISKRQRSDDSDTDTDQYE